MPDWLGSPRSLPRDSGMLLFVNAYSLELPFADTNCVAKTKCVQTSIDWIDRIKDRQHEQITKAIVGCAFVVRNEMGPGFLESAYWKALCIALPKKRLKVVVQHPIDVFFLYPVTPNPEKSGRPAGAATS